MSVVGPRPHMLKHTEDYSRLLDEYMIRHFVKPGVTGYWQVTGRSEVKFDKRIEMDAYYARKKSILFF